jgi:hypothetical protein
MDFEVETGRKSSSSWGLCLHSREFTRKLQNKSTLTNNFILEFQFDPPAGGLGVKVVNSKKEPRWI